MLQDRVPQLGQSKVERLPCTGMLAEHEHVQRSAGVLRA
jgi:hypothetical protein